MHRVRPGRASRPRQATRDPESPQERFDPFRPGPPAEGPWDIDTHSIGDRVGRAVLFIRVSPIRLPTSGRGHGARFTQPARDSWTLGIVSSTPADDQGRADQRSAAGPARARTTNPSVIAITKLSLSIGATPEIGPNFRRGEVEEPRQAGRDPREDQERPRPRPRSRGAAPAPPARRRSPRRTRRSPPCGPASPGSRGRSRSRSSPAPPSAPRTGRRGTAQATQLIDAPSAVGDHGCVSAGFPRSRPRSRRLRRRGHGFSGRREGGAARRFVDRRRRPRRGEARGLGSVASSSDFDHRRDDRPVRPLLVERDVGRLARRRPGPGRGGAWRGSRSASALR